MGFHIVKRDVCPPWKKVLLYVCAVLTALVLGGVLLLVVIGFLVIRKITTIDI